MAFSSQPQLAARLAAGAALLALACPAGAAISPADPAMASVSAEAALQPLEKPAPSLEWLALSDAIALASVAGGDNDSVAPSLLQTWSIADPGQHLLHVPGHREDRNLDAGEPLLGSYNLADEEPLLSENWWQAVPGVMTALIAGVMLYMRKPVQRKRKYRSTPHEPTGPYKRRDGTKAL